jgi:hypothetical protein
VDHDDILQEGVFASIILFANRRQMLSNLWNWRQGEKSQHAFR